MMLSILDPTISFNEVSNIPPPRVEIVSQKYYIENLCVCSCSYNRIYGGFYIDSNDKPVILLVTPDGATIPTYNISFDALTLHELTHYLQHTQGKWDDLDISDLEFERISRILETQAYNNQNKFMEYHNFPTTPISEKVEWSVKSDTANCTTGANQSQVNR